MTERQIVGLCVAGAVVGALVTLGLRATLEATLGGVALFLLVGACFAISARR